MEKDQRKAAAGSDWSADDYDFTGLVSLLEEIKTIFDNNYEAAFLAKIEEGELRYVRNNKAHEKMFGFSSVDIRGRTPVEVLGDEWGQRVTDYYRQVINSKRKLQFEEEHVTPAGSRTHQFNCVPIEIEGQVRYIIGTCVDITQQRETEKQLLEKQHFEKMTASISHLALREAETNIFLDKSLQILGEDTKASQALIMTNDESAGITRHILEWRKEDQVSKIDSYQQIPEKYLWAVKKLSQGEIIKYSDIEIIPDETTKASLRQRKIISLLVIPLLFQEAYYGFIALGSSEQRDWESEIPLLKVAAEIISFYLNKKQREYMLWMENQRFRTLYQFTDDIFFELDKEGRHVGVHGRWLEKSGFKPEDFLGRTDREIMGEEAAAPHEEANNKALRGLPASYEWSYDGGDRIDYYQTYVAPLMDPEGSITGLIGIGRNITDLVLVRQELQREKDLLYTTLRSIGDGVIAVDIEGNITYLNKAAEDISGWKMASDRGRHYSDFLHMVSAVSHHIIPDPVKEVLETKKPVKRDTVLLRLRGGSQVAIAYTLTPIIEEDEVAGAVMTFRDLSREVEQTERINYLNYHDPLTGLHNRRYMEEQIQHLDNVENLPLAIIIGDVNGLKLSNDVFGYEEGDRLLQRAAETMRRHCPADAVLARWGGDEFLALLPGTSLEEAENIMEEMKKSTYSNLGGRLRLSISMGCSARANMGDSFLMKLKEAEELMNQQKLTRGRSYRNSIISAMLATLYAKSSETEEHAVRLRHYCKALGQELKCTKREMQKLAVLAMLHDIGKIGISESILQKPGPLTREEWIEMKKHPKKGYRIAGNINELVYVAEDILYHHERWDGQGYPVGLSGEDIPLVCRILAVVDSYDAMTNDRVYRKAMSKEKAREELKRNAGTQFDPQVVKTFLQILDREAQEEIHFEEKELDLF